MLNPAIMPSTTAMEHRLFDESEFWRKIPAFQGIGREEFLDYGFQNRNTVKSAAELEELLANITEPDFLKDVRRGLDLAPMGVRLSPYILSLIDWDDPYPDPVRIQFVPVASTFVPDHPKLSLDSLNELDDSPHPGLVHRYPDKALFLPVEVCPVYCRFCTRSYAIGRDTATVVKDKHACHRTDWNDVFNYLESHPAVEDVVVSGGDAFCLTANNLREIAGRLLNIPHIQRIRFASRGPSVMPMKILTDKEWTRALVDVVHEARIQCKEVCLHTHFNSANEITAITREAMDFLYRRAVRIRNQSVLIRGVNDTPEAMTLLIKQLSYLNVKPYYVYQHDMIKGVEELRTRVADTLEIERKVRGATSGFNTPVFVNDVPGGGGKRDVYSFDHYDETTGVSVYRSPCVSGDKPYLYFDPIHLLPPQGQLRWADESQHADIVQEAMTAAGLDSESC